MSVYLSTLCQLRVKYLNVVYTTSPHGAQDSTQGSSSSVNGGQWLESSPGGSGQCRVCQRLQERLYDRNYRNDMDVISQWVCRSINPQVQVQVQASRKLQLNAAKSELIWFGSVHTSVMSRWVELSLDSVSKGEQRVGLQACSRDSRTPVRLCLGQIHHSLNVILTVNLLWNFWINNLPLTWWGNQAAVLNSKCGCRPISVTGCTHHTLLQILETRTTMCAINVSCVSLLSPPNRKHICTAKLAFILLCFCRPWWWDKILNKGMYWFHDWGKLVECMCKNSPESLLGKISCSWSWLSDVPLLRKRIVYNVVLCAVYILRE